MPKRSSVLQMLRGCFKMNWFATVFWNAAVILEFPRRIQYMFPVSDVMDSVMLKNLYHKVKWYSKFYLLFYFATSVFIA